ncbi:hypothetical protein A1O7_09622 [Cladophialophora yegresii CBS 114405]|uniref:Uncharacterized protein n=1 Tax=Cladophialophora yegresii CBS 114405 TaxID=1182544 RepID=W9W6W3_9EURO|nr:uncharacterized protein A1O7_09622 [Cladophialophora yegresii CBS 114405]EXJ54284.1 hypothetical protein A1O7_09622 [Cladophialophora yegresii CBS 114405]
MPGLHLQSSQWMQRRPACNPAPSPLIALLSLDWASAELALGLDFGTQWKVELTSSNIITLFYSCFDAYGPPLRPAINFVEVEELVVLAMQDIEARDEPERTGRSKLFDVVKSVFKSGERLSWVFMYEGGICRLFTRGPDQRLLEPYVRQSMNPG